MAVAFEGSNLKVTGIVFGSPPTATQETRNGIPECFHSEKSERRFDKDEMCAAGGRKATISTTPENNVHFKTVKRPKRPRRWSRRNTTQALPIAQ